MSDQHDVPAIGQLDRVQSELTRSLKRCRFLLDECRAKLAANSNEPHVLRAPAQDDQRRGR